jgi:hypothetical protein
MKTTPITMTTKGHRVWLQGTNEAYGWPVGARYDVTYTKGTILVVLNPTGKRKVSQGKGGIIDLTSQKVTRAIGHYSTAMVVSGNGRIVFEGVAA